jgi:hypothetical protein
VLSSMVSSPFFSSLFSLPSFLFPPPSIFPLPSSLLL